MNVHVKARQHKVKSETTIQTDVGRWREDHAGVHGLQSDASAYCATQPITKSGGFLRVSANALRAVNASSKTNKYSGMKLEANGKVSQPAKKDDGPNRVAVAGQTSALQGALLAAAQALDSRRTNAAVHSPRPHADLHGRQTAMVATILGDHFSRGRGYRSRSRVNFRHTYGLFIKRQEEKSVDIRATHPNYGSLVTQIHEVNKEADSDIEFLCKSYQILHNTAVMSVILFALLVIPISMVALGVNELPGCPKEPFIPIYLLVGGCVGILKLLNVIWRQLRTRYFFETPDSMNTNPPDRETFTSRKSTLFTDIVISLFLLVWFCLGNYWTWRLWKPKFSISLQEPNGWCRKTVYFFAIGQIVTCYGIIAVLLLLMASLCCCRQLCCYHDRIPKRAAV